MIMIVRGYGSEGRSVGSDYSYLVLPKAAIEADLGTNRFLGIGLMTAAAEQEPLAVRAALRPRLNPYHLRWPPALTGFWPPLF